jgi:hypothetical protein
MESVQKKSFKKTYNLSRTLALCLYARKSYTGLECWKYPFFCRKPDNLVCPEIAQEWFEHLKRCKKQGEVHDFFKHSEKYLRRFREALPENSREEFDRWKSMQKLTCEKVASELKK